MEILVIICSIIMIILLTVNLYVHIKKNHVYVIIHSTFGVISVTNELEISEDIIHSHYFPEKVVITEIDNCPHFPNLNKKPLKCFKVYGKYENAFNEVEESFNEYLVVLKVHFEDLI